MPISDLARLSGVSVPTLHRWENDQTVPQVDKLFQVAQVLGIGTPMDRLIDVPRNERYLSDWRALFGLLQPTLGQMLGVKTAAVSAIERGSRLPTQAQSADLARIYGITVEEVMECCARSRARPLGAYP
ncbi:helix-turn-helix transcriptional regulator [Rhodococcus pyridinivorans]|uniref:helix-turn-helix transcriptional regulator n=1 Tax=Rhodococcus pyridinivorans TaxID=103816 RepID=UPI0026595455|nr:helix-turn-helix transcriptional regulator [Rhodococcus pyridinivorans]